MRRSPKNPLWFVCLCMALGALTLPGWADGMRLVSNTAGNANRPAGGNGPSVSPQITPDGRFILFASGASDLVTNRTDSFALNLFLRDRASNATVLVSANGSGAGGNGDSPSGQVSTNGRFVVFQSDASDLVAGDTNGVTDIFLRDLQSGTTTLVSSVADGGLANGASTSPAITPDGRFVIFVSGATNLVPDDTNGLTDIFVRDQVAGTTACVTAGAVKAGRTVTYAVSPLIVEEAPRITPDGRYVAFYSTNDFGLGVPFTNAPYYSVGEIYVRDLLLNTTVWVSSNAPALVYSNFAGSMFPFASHPAISDDGQSIAFKTTLVDRAAPTAVFKFDLNSGTLTLLSTNSLPAENGVRRALVDDLFGPEISPDGHFISYGSRESGTDFFSVHVWDSLASTDSAASVDTNGLVQTNAFSFAPVFSRNSRRLAFISSATNLVANTVAAGHHVYLRDLVAGTNQLVDADTNGAATTDELGTVPSVSDDGQFVMFASPDGGLLAADNNGTLDILLRDTLNGTNEIISQRSPFVAMPAGNGLSFPGPYSMSADGRRVVFASYASDLVTNDFNDERDVFMTDLQTSVTLLMSAGTNGKAALGGSSTAPAISADGHWVAFASAATNLVADDTNNAADIFLRNLDTGVITRINVNSNGVTSGTGDASAPAISADGRYVVFLAKPVPSATLPGTFLKDTVGGRMTTLTTASAAAPSISADGQRVLWFSSTPQLNVFNVPTLTTIYTFSGLVSLAILSPTGTRVAYQYPSSKQLVVYNIAGATNMVSYADSTAMKNSSAWSRDGRFITFVSGAPLVANDGNGTNDVYLCDLQTGMLTLISANSNWTASANGISDSPAISSDARFVAFRSFASDVAPGVTNVPSLYLFDRTTGSNSLLATAAAGSWTSFVSQPNVSSNGNTVVFPSWSVAAVTNDLNRVQDVFASSQDSLVADSDADGIPDWWLLKFFGHATGRAGDLSRASDDADGDGLNNLQEFFAGTDPANPNAVLTLQISPGVSTNVVSLTWPAMPGKSYQVQYKDDLGNSGWTNYAGSVSVIGRIGSIAVPVSTPTRFYRALCVN